jgi:hypothetical protein
MYGNVLFIVIYILFGFMNNFYMSTTVLRSKLCKFNYVISISSLCEWMGYDIVAFIRRYMCT